VKTFFFFVKRAEETLARGDDDDADEYNTRTNSFLEQLSS